MLDQVGKKLLQGAKEWILAHPKNFNPETPYTDETVSIPAWIAIRSGWFLTDDPKDQSSGIVCQPPESDAGGIGKEEVANVEDIAALTLNLRPGVSRAFDPKTWPERYAKSYATAVRRRRPSERATATAVFLQAVIDGRVALGTPP